MKKLICLLGFFMGPLLSQASPVEEARQLFVSVGPQEGGWDSPGSQVYLFERKSVDSEWKKLWGPVDAMVGRNGLGWGVGLHSSALSKTGEPHKREGDGKAPAGAFSLVEAFGYADAADMDFLNSNFIEYHQVDSKSRCPDDYKSRFYNHNVYNMDRVSADWDSAERLRRDDPLYEFAIVVDHNHFNAFRQDRSLKKGSCIFLHVWRGAGKATAGCTAFSAAQMRRLWALLDARTNPMMVQLPRAHYESLKGSWRLPSL